MKTKRFWGQPWLCLCLVGLFLASSCASTRSNARNNSSRQYRFNLVLLPCYDQTLFDSVNSSDFGANLFNVHQEPRHVAFVLRLANEYEMQQIRSYWLSSGIVVESVLPEHQ